jgi:hypothetical protein
MTMHLGEKYLYIIDSDVSVCFKTLFQQMKSSSSNIYEMYFQHNRKEYMASAAYEFGAMTDEEQQHMAKLLRADLERILFEMIDQTVK